ncbi:MAG: hypothetical protein HRT88_04320 [Lentisphaeraceae bacterium]|nr:hypothetical protein [Lentisphaeraceae bacterium]
MEKKLPFSSPSDENVFTQLALSDVQKNIMAASQPFQTSDNTLFFNHGRSWSFNEFSTQESRQGDMEHHSASHILKSEDIAKMNFGVLNDFVEALAQQLSEQRMSMMCGALSEGVEGTPNSISITKDRPLAEVFKETIKALPGSLDTKGNLLKPSMIVDPEMYNRIINDASFKEPEHIKEMEELWEKKRLEAIAEREQRLAKYRKYEDE